jgi:formylglycine-generating enzyme required for sulfatase activity
VSWYAARVFCLFAGGDLPTEAQWEYAASAAGRPAKTRYPWVGDDVPSCDRALFGRSDDTLRGSTLCYNEAKKRGEDAFGPMAIDARETQDVTPITGVVNLGGNVNEWTKDSLTSYASPCWRAAPLLEPTCDEDEAPLRAARGGVWSGPQTGLLATFRSALQPHKANTVELGFRCAYAQSRPP